MSERFSILRYVLGSKYSLIGNVTTSRHILKLEKPPIEGLISLSFPRFGIHSLLEHVRDLVSGNNDSIENKTTFVTNV